MEEVFSLDSNEASNFLLFMQRAKANQYYHPFNFTCYLELRVIKNKNKRREAIIHVPFLTLLKSEI
jgi:hypothetical protein